MTRKRGGLRTEVSLSTEFSSDPDAAPEIMRQKMAVVPASSQFHGDLPLPWRWLGGVMCGFVLRPPSSLFSSQLQVLPLGL